MPMANRRPQLNLRVEPDQIAAYRREAARDGRSLSQWVRLTLDREIARIEFERRMR